MKTQYCSRADDAVSLEAEIVFPSENLPEQPGRVLAHRCSHGMYCNLYNDATCMWAGTNPAYDPFAERS